MKYIFYILVIAYILVPLDIYAKSETIKKVLYVNSYHSGYAWSDGITKAIKNTIRKSEMKIDLKIIEMNTKLNYSEKFKIKAGLNVKHIIESFKPDVVIVSDDNAAKYVIVPYYLKSSLPFVFCGINGSEKIYNFSNKNVTGMLEVTLVPQLIEVIKKYSKGNRIVYFNDDTLSSRKVVLTFEKKLKTKVKTYFITSKKELEKYFVMAQKEADILILGTFPKLRASITKKYLKEYILKHTIIPSVATVKLGSEIALLTFANKPEEQGEWAANTALDILKGKKVSQIKMVENKKAEIYINVTLMKKLKIVLPLVLLENASMIE